MSTVSDQTVNCIGLGVWVLVFKYCPRCLLVEAWQTPLSCCVWIFSFVKLKITIPILQLRINSALLLYFYLCAKTNDVITHLEPDILECQVKWALGSITTNKASGGDGIPGELFQILKDDAVKVLHSMSANLENSAVATGLEKVSFHSHPKKRQCQRIVKLLHNCTHLTH